ncbi:hypothetical protein [Haloarcula nitratireducens]|uniref:Uncharacterized protein n=1 Tax=Haloarcula nitratireducens TaxID=2487749 RepID=A0AAW4PB67_9EURY|nr:hypothetical protein [Halomicroarcula nitratireducens]MBX0294910.1 hypothetical protein [Halomicroarcula nitratireducens]
MRIEEPIRVMSVLSIAVFGLAAIGMDIPWPPIAALISVPLLISLPVELARHWDFLDAQISHHSHRDPDEAGETAD